MLLYTIHFDFRAKTGPSPSYLRAIPAWGVLLLRITELQLPVDDGCPPLLTLLLGLDCSFELSQRVLWTVEIASRWNRTYLKNA